MREGCQIGFQKAHILCYANDILILSPSASSLQAQIGNIMNKSMFENKYTEIRLYNV